MTIAGTGRSDEVRTWAVDRFNATGATVDGLVAAAVDLFCRDGDFVREFVVENLRAEIVAGMAGLVRTREMQAQFPDSVRSPQPPARPVAPEPVRTPASLVKPVDADKPPRPARVRTQARNDPATPPWAKALALDPGRRTFRPLLALTREELLEGAGYLAIRSDVLRSLADRLKPGQRVSDAMGERELNDLVARLTADAISGGAQGAPTRPLLRSKPPKPYRESLALVANGSGPGSASLAATGGAGEQ